MLPVAVQVVLPMEAARPLRLLATYRGKVINQREAMIRVRIIKLMPSPEDMSWRAVGTNPSGSKIFSRKISPFTVILLWNLIVKQVRVA